MNKLLGEGKNEGSMKSIFCSTKKEIISSTFNFSSVRVPIILFSWRTELTFLRCVCVGGSAIVSIGSGLVLCATRDDWDVFLGAGTGCLGISSIFLGYGTGGMECISITISGGISAGKGTGITEYGFIGSSDHLS